jgi:hypothetical protein
MPSPFTTGIFLSALSLPLLAAAQTTADIGGSHHPSAKPVVMKVETVPRTPSAARDSMVAVRGIMIDREENTRMSNVRIFFIRREKRLMVGVLANEKGEFSRKIAPGTYDIEAQFTGKSALKIENYPLISGANYYIRVEMGNANSKAAIERRR